MFPLGLIAALFFNDANAATVFPIASNAFSAGIAFDGTNYLSAMLADTNVSVQLVSAVGALIGSPVIVGANPSLNNVALAFGKTNYLTVWSDNTVASGVSIFGQLISRSGVKVGSSFNLLSAQGSHGLQTVEALAFDGTNFLAVWQDQTSRNFYGQLVTGGGTLSGSAFLISSQQQNGSSAAVTFGRTNYLVIWQSNNGSIGNTNKTYGAFVSPNGSVTSPFQIGQTAAPDQNFLSAAFDGTNYLAAWQWDPYPETGGSVTNWNIFGRLVSPTGTFPGNELQLVTDVGNNVIPSLAFDGSNYLLTWGYGFNVTTNTNIRFQFLDRTASTIGPRFTLFTTQGTNAPLIAINGLIFDGTRFAMAATLGDFSSGAVYGGFIPSSTALPKLNSDSFTNKQFSLTLTGTPGINYAIQTSTNLSLANWIGLVTNSPTNGTFSFTDSHATNASRFYRAAKQ